MPAPRDNLTPLTSSGQDAEPQEGAETLQPGAEVAPGGEAFPEWAESAWRLYQRGQRNYSALGRQFGVHNTTVRRWIIRFSQIMQAARSEESVDAQLQYVTGLEETLSEAWRLHATAEQESTKVACLNRAESILEKLAAAEGVVTKREGRDYSGTLDVNERYSGASREKLARVGRGLAKALDGGSCADEPADAGGLSDAGAVPIPGPSDAPE